jgi:hypothetical protein
MGETSRITKRTKKRFYTDIHYVTAKLKDYVKTDMGLNLTGTTFSAEQYLREWEIQISMTTARPAESSTDGRGLLRFSIRGKVCKPRHYRISVDGPFFIYGKSWIPELTAPDLVAIPQEGNSLSLRKIRRWEDDTAFY